MYKSPEEYSETLNLVSAQEHLPLEEFMYLVNTYRKRYELVLDPDATWEEQMEAYNKCIEQFDNLMT